VYLGNYRLDKEPFSSSPDPDFLWLSAKHSAALETLREGVLIREGCVLLTGDIGTGKTILVKRLSQLDNVAAIFLTIHEAAGLTRLDFCNILAVECGLHRRFKRREEFYTAFKHFLSKTFSASKKVLIVIDEAQRLDPEILQEAVKISYLPAGGRALLKVVFVGQLELDQALKKKENRTLLQNITARYCLEPLTKEETRLYVGHRLKTAGGQTKLFTEDALDTVHALSRGYPRLINIVCDHALLYGYGANRKEIDSQIVRDCSQNLAVALDLDLESDPGGQAPASAKPIESSGSPPSASAGRSWRPIIFLAAAVAVAGMAFFMMTR
jgi:type II secretory pathway predicted ATPase ExeA